MANAWGVRSGRKNRIQPRAEAYENRPLFSGGGIHATLLPRRSRADCDPIRENRLASTRPDLVRQMANAKQDCIPEKSPISRLMPIELQQRSRLSPGVRVVSKTLAKKTSTMNSDRNCSRDDAANRHPTATRAPIVRPVRT